MKKLVGRIIFILSILNFIISIVIGFDEEIYFLFIVAFFSLLVGYYCLITNVLKKENTYLNDLTLENEIIQKKIEVSVLLKELEHLENG